MFDLLVAIRFLKEGRTQTILIIAGIAVGISVQIFLSALVTALQKDLIQTTVGQSPHITAEAGQSVIQNPLENLLGQKTINQEVSFASRERIVSYWPAVVQQLDKLPELKVVSPAVIGSGFVNRGEKSLPVIVQGFELDKADIIYNLENRIVEGQYSAGGNEVMIGIELAKELRLGIGDVVRILNSEGVIDSFTIAGIFDLESQPINKSWVIMSLQRAQIFFDIRGSITAIQMQVFDVFKAEAITNILRSSFSELSWISWQEENEALLSALESQSSSSIIIQVFVLIAVTMGISSVLAVSAVQKSKQIGILKALGTTTSSIIRIFLIQGGMLGFAGALAGSVLSVLLVRAFLYFTALGTGEIIFPIEVEPALLIASIIIATLAGTIAAALPAFKTAKLNPAEVIKNG